MQFYSPHYLILLILIPGLIIWYRRSGFKNYGALQISSEKYKEKNRKITDFSENKGSELIKYRGKSSLTISKTLSYIIVSLISFIGLIILLDTFKNPLSVFFPNIELFLYNLFETLRDLFLFAKDLK